MLAKQALSIGINDYVPRRFILEPCLNDAGDITQALRLLGFRAHFAKNLGYKSMKSVTDQFVHSIQPGAIVVFYFSGHACQFDGNNYLIPTNAVGIWAGNINSTAIDAQKLISSMHKRRPRVVICILDCCRTDAPTEPIDEMSPYGRALAGMSAGLAPMQAPPATIIVYACAANDVASAASIDGRNSLYTSHLLHYILTPNVDIETLLKCVARNVERESKSEQIPYRYSSCNEAIYLAAPNTYNALMPFQDMHRRPVVQSLHRKRAKSLPAKYPQPQPQLKHFHKQWNGQHDAQHTQPQLKHFHKQWNGQHGAQHTQPQLKHHKQWNGQYDAQHTQPQLKHFHKQWNGQHGAQHTQPQLKHFHKQFNGRYGMRRNDYSVDRNPLIPMKRVPWYPGPSFPRYS
ncbi:unnamed protein product [Rotaria sp. Silwood2]|nr:unnamed protein product [Rotaria sp. Silwood2]CAF2644492.1 unnamed protein product [Rotaria sp. Silwood2]CAF3057955.1 unnamed protein product [Rotaria sp. Silwood2]CAF3872250.1 unnamed protein product [Rotaria sp. Silwood2]CAF4030885.1 unnamed protein product [Rotaria sp. Silwood2]